jgi:hypothetical protein
MVQFRLPKTGGTQEKVDAVLAALRSHVKLPVTEYQRMLEKEVYTAFGLRLTKADYSVLKKRIRDGKLATLRQIEEAFASVVGTYIDDFDIQKRSKTNLYRQYEEGYLRDLSVQLFVAENKTLRIISDIMKINFDYDVSLLKREIALWNPAEYERNARKFMALFKGDYEQEYMHALMQNPAIQRFVKEGRMFVQFSEGGKLYDIQKYIENRAERMVVDVTRESFLSQIKEQKTDIIRFIRLNPATTPREHSGFEGKRFSLHNRSDIKGVLPISVLEQLPINERVTRDGIFPIGCNHIFEPT